MKRANTSNSGRLSHVTDSQVSLGRNPMKDGHIRCIIFYLQYVSINCSNDVHHIKGKRTSQSDAHVPTIEAALEDRHEN